MTRCAKADYAYGRRILERLEHGCELTAALTHICDREEIRTAAFSIIGNLSEMTIGTFDQQQQVYVTHRQKGFFEILTCSGTITGTREHQSINARLAVADPAGSVTGGALFADTIVYAAELDLRELVGPDLKRSYDMKTGLRQWTLP